ncbi:unnamed protein product [Lactuca saligna]|uniref:DUF1985 domain-containing protein n=1 Tax=Lactuca saligna TaxID=75948 RepID=A0AA35VMM2_LACSI|nr:unnamed protein product [Lactuca saligna]
MHVPNGDPLLVHLMMLLEVRSQEVFVEGRFRFEIQGVQLKFGETKYILISGLRVGPYVDLLHEERGHSNSNLWVRLFPNITDATLRVKHLTEYIMSPQHMRLHDADAILLIQLVFMLKGLHGQDVKTSISTAVYKLVDNICDWNRFPWGTYFWSYTSKLMHGMFEKIENFRLFKETNPESKKTHKYTVVGFMLPFKVSFIWNFQ